MKDWVGEGAAPGVTFAGLLRAEHFRVMWPQWESRIGMSFGLRRSMPAASSSRREGEQDPSRLPCGSPPWYSGDRSDLIDSVRIVSLTMWIDGWIDG